MIRILNETLLNNTICKVFDPDAPQAKQGFDNWMYIAYSFLLFSYININVLVLRLCLTIAAVFFVVWGFDPVRAVQLDCVIFSLIHILINIVMSVPLVKQIWPVKLSELEEEIYQRDFGSYMSKKQFKHMIKNFKLKTYDADDSQLCCYKSNFEYVIYVAKINPGWTVRLTKESSETLTELREGSWIGVIEYMFEQDRKPNSPMIKWGITATIRQDQPLTNRLTTENHIFKEDAGCIIYYFEIEVFFFNLRNFLNFTMTLFFLCFIKMLCKLSGLTILLNILSNKI
jgi:hypothetical protein